MAQKSTVSKPNTDSIPDLAPYWKKLDLAELLALPSAFVSISQCNSLYYEKGAQGSERHWERGNLENTVKVAKACRQAGSKFYWIGYDIFRKSHGYPMTPMDEVQYSAWEELGKGKDEAYKKWDGELVDDLKALVQTGDEEFFELALESSFCGTQLPLSLARNNIKTIVLCGIHLDWCIEGNARAARDNGLMPIVVGDACACQRAEDEPAALRRINAFFAPVISADRCVALIKESMKRRKAAA
ncbi:MAG: cysteine hydrolase [Burkholderiales bacterium]